MMLRTWIFTSILWILLFLDSAELQEVVFPKSKDGKNEKGMAHSWPCLFNRFVNNITVDFDYSS